MEQHPQTEKHRVPTSVKFSAQSLLDTCQKSFFRISVVGRRTQVIDIYSHSSPKGEKNGNQTTRVTIPVLQGSNFQSPWLYRILKEEACRI